MNFFGEDLPYLLTAICVAMVGGIANWLMSEDHSIFQFVVAVFLAGFAGFLVGELCLEAKISESWAFFFCGTAGLSAEIVLKVCRRFFLRKLGRLTGEDISLDVKSIFKDDENEDKK